MRVASSIQRLPLLPAGCRLAGPCSTNRSKPRLSLAVRPRAQAGDDAGPVAAAAAAAEQVAAVPAPVAQAVAAIAEQQQDEVAEAVSDATTHGSSAQEEQQAARQAVAVSAGAGGGSTIGGVQLPFDINLQHPYVKVAGWAAGIFLGGTLLITLFRMSRDPTLKRSKTINKNKAVVDTVCKYLPGNRAGLSGASFTLLKVQTGFTNVEIFRKYLWFLLRERQFDEEALGDLMALKAALSLDDAQVAEALKERAQRVYEKYGTVMVNMEGMSQAGIERKAASRNLFIKLLSLTESRQLLGQEAAATVNLSKIFGVTPRDILTLRSGYSAEAEGEQQPENSDEE